MVEMTREGVEIAGGYGAKGQERRMRTIPAGVNPKGFLVNRLFTHEKGNMLYNPCSILEVLYGT